jgi:hypothetical protein
MTRDLTIYGRALRLSELVARQWRMGRKSRDEYRARQAAISRAHYRAQHKAGATDYPCDL